MFRTLRLFSTRRKGNTTEVLFQKVKNHNEDFTKILGEVGDCYKLQGNLVKFNSYDKAVKALTSLPYKITTKEEAKGIPNIGKRMLDKIQMILETNSLPQLDEFKNDESLKKIRSFCRIHGVGPSQAKKWVTMGLNSIDDLSNVKLTKYQIIGLKYLEEFEKRIPRDEMDIINDILMNRVKGYDPTITSLICGSYRRNLPTSGDVDMIITHESYKNESKNQGDLLKNVVENLEETGIITDRISLGKTKFMGVLQLNSNLAPGFKQEKFLHRRIDIRLIPLENYWCGKLFFNI